MFRAPRWAAHSLCEPRVLGMEQGADLGVGPGADLGVGPGADLGVGPGADLGVGPGADLGVGPGADLGWVQGLVQGKIWARSSGRHRGRSWVDSNADLMANSEEDPRKVQGTYQGSGERSNSAGGSSFHFEN